MRPQNGSNPLIVLFLVIFSRGLLAEKCDSLFPTGQTGAKSYKSFFGVNYTLGDYQALPQILDEDENGFT
jgi:hypothetical protein